METKNEQTKIKQIEGTPFHIVSHNFEKEGEKHFVALGMNRVSPLFDKIEQAEEYVLRWNNWELTCAVIGVIAEKVFTDLNNQ